MKRDATTKSPAARAERSDAGTVEQQPVGVLRRHPKHTLIPRLGRQDFAAFRADVGRRGLLVPLEITASLEVLDGHLRLRAALELGLESVPVRIVEPADELEYMVLAALQRRQLDAGQRAALALQLEQYQQTAQQAKRRQRANLKQNGGSEGARLPPRGKTRELVAGWANVSPRTAQDAITVQAADPDLFEEVKQGAISVDRAARQVRQRQRDDSLATAPPLPDGQFDLIYADPPWRLPGRPDSSRAIENHYPTLPLEQIKAIPIPAASAAVLYLWAVNSLLPQALEVIDAWGFHYATNYAWLKDKWGLGHWNRTQHELLLVAIRGSVPPPAEGVRASSVIQAARRRHSQKPDQIYELLERLHPHTTRLELFARQSRPGWNAWGNQAPND